MTARPKTPKRSRRPSACVQPRAPRQKRARSEHDESSSAAKRRKRNDAYRDTLTVDTSAIAGPSSAPDPFSAMTPPTPNGLGLNCGEMPAKFPAHLGRNDGGYQSWVQSQHPSVQYEHPLTMPPGGYGMLLI
jgi:hypothetical protein